MKIFKTNNRAPISAVTISHVGTMAMASIVLMLGVIMTLFAHWEAGGESWGYWFFARVFAETGKFVIPGRSPLYVLYLNIFKWMEYPFSVIAEYLVTSLITVFSLMFLFKKRIGLLWAVFASILWIPFFQVSEPPTQSLALACSCLAVLARNMRSEGYRIVVSYTLLVMAYMMRSNYMAFILVFVVWDGIRFFRKVFLKKARIKISLKLTTWPVILVMILLLWFSFAQSSHTWNNAWFGDTTWFPCDGKNLSDAAFLHNYNWLYISDKYGTFEGKDFYFTNQDVFNGAKNIFNAVSVNPLFVVKMLVCNMIGTFRMIAGFMMLPKFFSSFPSEVGRFHYILFFLITVPCVSAIFYGALRACKNGIMRTFIIANGVLIATSIISLPSRRYMQPLIPILVFSAFWYGKKVWNVFKKLSVLHRVPHRVLYAMRYSIMAFIFVCFSNGFTMWKTITKDFANDIAQDDIRIMEARLYSPKAAFNEIEPLVKDCNGVLSLESTFAGAFMDIPLDKIYGVYEIPPFGKYGSSEYDGLRPVRINCVLASSKLANSVGFGTNSKMRYENYIVPYMNYLKKKGAKIYDIESFGKAVVLQKFD